MTSPAGTGQDQAGRSAPRPPWDQHRAWRQTRPADRSAPLPEVVQKFNFSQLPEVQLLSVSSARC